MKILIIFIFIFNLYIGAQENSQSFTDKEVNRLEVQDRFPRFRVQYPFERVIKEVENSVKKETSNLEEKKDSK